MKKIILLALLSVSVFFTGCMDEFADQNTNQSVVTKPDIRYVFTKALDKFEPAGYTQWFYNNSAYMLTWTQATIGDRGGANSKTLNIMGAYSGQQSAVVDFKVYVEEIDFILSTYTDDDAFAYQNIRAICNPLLVYLGIFGTDMYGSMAYTEAGKAFHTEPPLLTPKYETQTELIDLWLSQLDETLRVLGENHPRQIKLDGQDFIYKGDLKKWMKLTNSLKLKIAVRLLHQDKARAFRIAKEVVTHSAGILSSIDDDFIYNKGSQQYHFGDNLWLGVGSEHFVKFLVENRDPRLRFIYQKNDFNSKVVQAFIDYKVRKPQSSAKLPSYVEDMVNFDVVNGKKVFNSWKAPGEPWVRYFGGPVNVLAADDGVVFDNYFNLNNSFKLDTVVEGKSVSRTYAPLSYYNEETVRGQKSYTFPDSPEVSATKDEVKNPWFGLFMSAAEVHLYLAELRLLGADLPRTSEEYFKDGIRLSVEVLDNLAGKNKIPYYSSVYDPNEATIALQPNEITDLYTKPAYQLTGTPEEQLEKIYIQQYIHFLHLPNEMYVSVRRSGVPKRNSSILKWENFSQNNDAGFIIPRRYEISTPLMSDMMYNIKVNAFTEQGYTTSTSNDPTVLNTQRVWYDKGAPNFGEGPNVLP